MLSIKINKFHTTFIQFCIVFMFNPLFYITEFMATGSALSIWLFFGDQAIGVIPDLLKWKTSTNHPRKHCLLWNAPSAVWIYKELHWVGWALTSHRIKSPRAQTGLMILLLLLAFFGVFHGAFLAIKCIAHSNKPTDGQQMVLPTNLEKASCPFNRGLMCRAGQLTLFIALR